MRDALRLLPVIVRNWLRTSAQLHLEILALRHRTYAHVDARLKALTQEVADFCGGQSFQKGQELNPVEYVWRYLRQNWLSDRIFTSHDDIVDHCCYAWNQLTDRPWTIMSIGLRDWSRVGHSQ